MASEEPIRILSLGTLNAIVYLIPLTLFKMVAESGACPVFLFSKISWRRSAMRKVWIIFRGHVNTLI